MKIAAVDVGTNSIHLMIGGVGADGQVEVIERAKDMVRLGDSAFSAGVLSPEAFARAREALLSFRRMAERHGCDAMLAVATSAVREAQNGGEFVRAMRDETGVDLRVVSGEEEARLIFLGARSVLSLAGRRVLLCDIGGGSVEIMVGDSRELYHARSLKLGVLRLLDRITTDPLSVEEHTRLQEHCHRVLAKVELPMRRIGFDFVALSAGTARALAELCAAGAHLPSAQATTGRPKSGESAGRARSVRFEDLYALERRLCAMTSAERERIAGLDPRRTDSIVPGVILVRSLLEAFHADEYVLCEAGLREGLIQDYAGRNRPGIRLADEFPDVRRRSVMGLMRRTNVLRYHSEHVARLALDLFRGTRALHGLPNSDGELLEFGALLHDVGYHIAASRHHKHGQYLVENIGLAGFSDEEIRLLALLVRYHRKATPKDSHEPYDKLGEPLKRRVRVLSALLRVADGLDRTCQRLVSGVRCRISAKDIDLILATAGGDVDLELWSARRKGDLMQEVFGRKLHFTVEVQQLEIDDDPKEEAAG